MTCRSGNGSSLISPSTRRLPRSKGDFHNGQIGVSPSPAADVHSSGYPLDDQDAFPSALQTSLERDCPLQNWEVINGGVPGYTVVQGWQFYQMKFRSYHFDRLLLSFLNNDAWTQPQRDVALMSQYGSILKPIGDLARQSRLIHLCELIFRPPVPPSRYVARVTLEDFVARLSAAD